MRGPAFCAYADNYLIDVKFGIIVDVEASRAIRQAEVGAAKTMIERTRRVLRSQAGLPCHRHGLWLSRDAQLESVSGQPPCAACSRPMDRSRDRSRRPNPDQSDREAKCWFAN